MDRVPLTAWQRRRLQRQLHTTRDARLYRRTLALLEVNRGTPIPEVAQVLGVTPRSIYHWIDAYTQAHDPEALADDARGGRPSLWEAEHRDLLQELIRVQVDVEGVLLYHDWIKGWLDVAPTPRDRMRIAKLHAEELVHGYQFLKMYRQVDRELTEADFVDDQGRKAQYIFSYAFDTWTDIALLNTLADRMGAFIFQDMTECSYLPWRRLIAATK